MKIISFNTNKGGVLKSSVTTNIASVLSLQGKKCLIIDLDNQGNVSLTFGKNPDQFENTIYDVLVEGMDINKAIVNVATNIDIIPANDDMSYFELDVLRKPSKFPKPFDLLKNALSNLQGPYDYIFIDTPPNMGLTIGNMLNTVDEVITPFHPETYSLRSLTKTIKAVENFKQTNPKLKLSAIIGTKVKQTNLHNANMHACDGFAQANNIKMAQNFIPETIVYANAVGKYRLPLVLCAKTVKEKKAVNTYMKLAKELNL